MTKAYEQQSLDKAPYSNNLNDISSEKFARFTLTSHGIPVMKKQDYLDFVKDEIKPLSVREELFRFFTKKGDSVLDLYSGYGSNLTLASDLGLDVIGVEIDQAKIEAYQANFGNDLFEDPIPIIQGDVFDVATKLANEGKQFKFIIADPPNIKRDGVSWKVRVQEQACIYNKLVETYTPLLSDGGFLVIIARDFYADKMYVPCTNMLNANSRIHLNGLTVYTKEMESRFLLNRKVYAPFINHYYALIFNNIL